MKIDVNKICCICRGGRSSPLFKRAYQEHGYPGLFSLHMCESCGLIFNSPRLAPNELKALYGKNYYFFKRSPEEEFRRMAPMFTRTVAMVDRDVASKRVLEIGSAKGYFLAVLQSLGWDVRGIELSEEAVRFAKDSLGVDSFQGDVTDFTKQYSGEKFPLVLAIDVLEHVPDPEAFCDSIASLVEKDGFVIVDTPNGDALNIAQEGQLWQGFNPFHIYLFDKNNLSSLLERSGFIIEYVFSYGNTVRNPSRTDKIKRKLKDSILILLRRMHLLNFVKSFPNREVNLKEIKRLISQTQRDILMKGSYFKEEDAVAPLAKEQQGDNLIIIARKRL